MTTTTLQVIKSPQQEAFEEYIQTQKCPFRTYKRDFCSEKDMEYMMPCDPNCVALFTEHDYSSYSCLRLTDMRYNLSQPCYIEGVHIQEDKIQ